MQSSVSRGTPIGAIIVIIGGALLAVGSFLTWLTLTGQGLDESASGIDGSDGWITLGAGAVAVVVGIVATRAGRKSLAGLAIVAGIVGGGMGVYDAMTVRDQIADDVAEQTGATPDQARAAIDELIDGGLMELSMGIGLYLVIGGGALALVGGVVMLATGARPPVMPATVAPTPAQTTTAPAPVTPAASMPMPASPPREQSAPPPPPAPPPSP
jgi:hypothetical protein